MSWRIKNQICNFYTSWNTKSEPKTVTCSSAAPSIYLYMFKRKIYNIQLQCIIQSFDYYCSSSGICFNNGQAHLEMRKLALATFRNLGVGKRTLDETIQTECTFFLNVMEHSAAENDGIVHDVKSTARQCTANILHDIIFGFR